MQGVFPMRARIRPLALSGARFGGPVRELCSVKRVSERRVVSFGSGERAGLRVRVVYVCVIVLVRLFVVRVRVAFARVARDLVDGRLGWPWVILRIRIFRFESQYRHGAYAVAGRRGCP